WVASCSDEKLRQRVKTGIARARSHGFTWENSIGKFVCLMFRWAPNFDECPAMKSVLERSDVEPEARADLLFDLTDEQWEAARRRYDPAAWEEE
ncbi:MAG TPA: hypothetical protein VM120_29125, partial [Bryobacteraceae bacterium]|nr:hypothetical protein [Bryobacteraceae bacterium]